MLFYILLIILLILLYHHLSVKRKIEYWKKQGIPYFVGKYGFGILLECFTSDRPEFEILDDIYKKYPDAPAVATVAMFHPTMVIRDPVNVGHVLATDFNNFNHKGVEVNGDVDVLADNIVFMTGVRWKLTRQHFSPLFTSAKLRNMFYIMNKSAHDHAPYFKTRAKNETAFDVLTKFCCATISATVFGIENKTLTDTIFLNICRQAFKQSLSLSLKFALANNFASLFAFFKLKLFNRFEDTFIYAMKQVLEARKTSTVKTHDFADLCVDVQRKGIMRDPATGYEIEPTDELLCAQAFFFQVAGVEPVATCMYFTLYEMVMHPDILQKIHEEIDDAFDSNNGAIDYNDIVKMEYLDKVIDEAMRIHPPLGQLSRRCTVNTTLPVGNIPLAKGTQVSIPVFSIHNDPKYYPNPEVFDPERFSADAKQGMGFTYLPFGAGNRICLALRYARLQAKTGIAHILRRFTLRTDHMNTKMKYAKTPFQLRAANVDFDFVPRIPKS